MTDPTNPNTERFRMMPSEVSVEGSLGASSAGQGAVTPNALAPTLDLAALTVIAKGATPGPWEVWANAHCDPVVIPAGGTPFQAITDPNMPFERVTGLSTSPSDYGRANLNYVAAFDPPTVLALIARVTAAESSLARYIVDRTRFGDAMAIAAVPAVVDAIMRELTTDSDRRAREATARAEAAEAKVAAVRAIHKPKETTRESWRVTTNLQIGPESVTVLMCAGCSANYPCPTIAALDGTA